MRRNMPPLPANKKIVYPGFRCAEMWVTGYSETRGSRLTSLGVFFFKKNDGTGSNSAISMM